ncbi:DUF4214 domain-containing protein [Pannonibacter sp. SL95]|uniref:DUF4214 domain-containing protein n=1 Tax=Pannonibacter sp. SL95 TaxID=2995153 RepID=UPI002274351C|nr:DUF4214 domain-containing protein [Pannonibacter sp. SL95]MCY1708961.1 DUF4214 domain-containing protein [Pannonibacter sp. SL95]
MTTADRIVQLFQNVLQRTPELYYSTTYAYLVDKGVRSFDSFRDELAGSAEAVTYVDQVIRIYQAAFGRVPDVTGISGWVKDLRADATALSKVAAGFVNSQEWKNRYGDNSVSDVSLGALYQNVLGRAGSAAEIAAWKATGQPMTQILIGFSNSAEFQAKSAAAVLALKTAAGAVAAADLAKVYNGKSPLDMSNRDGALILTAGDDVIKALDASSTIIGTVSTGAGGTFQSGDQIDGGAGYDTLRLINDMRFGDTALPVASVSNVEALHLDNLDYGRADSQRIDLRSWTGLESVSADTSGSWTMLTHGNVREVTSSGWSAAIIEDTAGAGGDRLASVTLFSARQATIRSDALTDLKLISSRNNDHSRPEVFKVEAAARPLNLDLVSTTRAIHVIDETATSLQIRVFGGLSSISSFSPRATSVSVDADEIISFETVNWAAARSLTITGDSMVLFLDGPTALTTLDATGSSGNVTVTREMLNTSIASGAGSDRYTSASTSSSTRIDLGAGDDWLAIRGTDYGSVNGGAGIDRLVTQIASITNGALPAAASRFSGFEVLEVASSGLTAPQTIDVTPFNATGQNAITTVALTGRIVSQPLTVKGLASGGTLQLSGYFTDGVTVVVDGAATRANDSFTFEFKGEEASVGDFGIKVADVETVNFRVDTTPPRGGGGNFSGAAVQTITVTGNGATLWLGDYTGTALRVLDAASFTGGVGLTTKDVLTGPVTVLGGKGNDTISAATAAANVTMDGGTGDDVLTGSATWANALTGGDGNDTLTGGAATDTLSGGAGNDVIITGTGADMVDVGSGLDTVVLSMNSGRVTSFVTIAGMGKGDRIDLADDTRVASFVAAKVTAPAGTTFQKLLDTAAAGDVGRVTWFQFEGNTYIVQDLSRHTIGFNPEADQLVKLTGLVDLSTATLSGGSAHLLTI